jgi:hypothetical protein
MRFEFQSWLTKKNSFHNGKNRGIPVPMRVMFGKVISQTDKGYYIEVYGKPEPTTHCLHCMHPLTHKVSMFYGLGPHCGKHFYISGISEENLEEHLDTIRKNMAEVQWKGFVPKVSVHAAPENFHTFEFIYNGTQYRVTTSDMTKVKQIRTKSDRILSEVISQG